MKLLLRKKHAGERPETAKTPPASRRRWLAVAAVVLALGGFGYSLHVRGMVSTEDAFIDGRVHPIPPRVAGYVNAVPVDDNQRVRPGEVLVVLDPTDYKVALAQARAD